MQPISLAEHIFLLSTISVGFVLNCVLLVVVITLRQLRYPRHLFWCAVALINVFYLIQCVIEIVANVYKDRILCQIFVLNFGVGYSLLLQCLSLAALDRYMAIKNQEWYKRRVTNRAVIIVLCGSSTITYLAITSPYWTGNKKISTCTINLTHMNCVLSWDLLLGIIGFTFHFMIYIKSKAVIRLYPPQHNPIPVTFQFRNTHRPDSTACEGGVNIFHNIKSYQCVLSTKSKYQFHPFLYFVN